MKEYHLPNVYIKTIAEEEYIPKYAHHDDAGADLKAYIEGEIPLFIGEIKGFRTGVKIELPHNVAGFVRSRSGLARNHGISVYGGGTIDPGYRGEIGITLINLGDRRYTIKPGERIAQLVLVPIIRAGFQKADVLSETLRGESGFGASGR